MNIKSQKSIIRKIVVSYAKKKKKGNKANMVKPLLKEVDVTNIIEKLEKLTLMSILSLHLETITGLPGRDFNYSKILQRTSGQELSGNTYLMATSLEMGYN